MHPIALEIGNFTLRWYGVMAALGFLAASGVVLLNRRFAKLTSDQASTLVFTAIIAGIVGARIFYVIQFYREYFAGHFWRIFRVDQGGLVFYGGFFLALAAIYLYCRRNKLDTIRVFDVLTPSLCIGHLFGRIGCFLNGCCFGKPTLCALGIAYPPGSEPFHRYGALTLHPVQLYEAGINLLIFLFVMWLLRHSRRGMVTAAYLILYGVIRFADEFFRGDHTQHLAGLTPAQVIGLLLIPSGAALFVYFWKQNGEDDEQANP